MAKVYTLSFMKIVYLFLDVSAERLKQEINLEVERNLCC